MQDNSLGATDRSSHLFVLSAPSTELLQHKIDYCKRLLDQCTYPLADITHTLNRQQKPDKHRIAVIAKDTAELRFNLQKNDYLKVLPTPTKVEIAFIFAGEGSQYFSMGRKLYQSNALFKETINELCVLFQKEHIHGLRENFATQTSSATQDIRYPLANLFCLQVALTRLWISWGLKPTYILGLNVNYFYADYQGSTPKQLAGDNHEIQALLDAAIERLANSPSTDVLSQNALSSGWANYWSLWSFFSRRNNTSSPTEAQQSYFSRLPRGCMLL